jgi:hypothetical protein
MRVRVKITILVVVLALLVSVLSLAPVRASAEVIDRIVATVNGRIILQSDWDEALCYEALSRSSPTTIAAPFWIASSIRNFCASK